MFLPDVKAKTHFSVGHFMDDETAMELLRKVRGLTDRQEVLKSVRAYFPYCSMSNAELIANHAKAPGGRRRNLSLFRVIEKIIEREEQPFRRAKRVESGDLTRKAHSRVLDDKVAVELLDSSKRASNIDSAIPIIRECLPGIDISVAKGIYSLACAPRKSQVKLNQLDHFVRMHEQSKLRQKALENRSRTIDSKKLQTFEEQVFTTQERFAERLQVILNEMADCEFNSLSEKRNVTRRIQRLLAFINRKVECLRCGQPAGLKVVRSFAHETGVFQFDHTHPSRSTHQGPVNFPQLRIVNAPEDKRYSEEAEEP